MHIIQMCCTGGKCDEAEAQRKEAVCPCGGGVHSQLAYILPTVLQTPPLAANLYTPNLEPSHS